MRVVFAFLINTIFNLIVGLIVAKFLGPDEYGRFALAIGVMIFGQALAFEWIRQCAIRFYSDRTRERRPHVRASLDAAFVMSAAGFVPLAGALAYLGPEFSLPRNLVALAFAASIANGLFDYQTALARARFDDRLYMRVVLGKNLLALVLTAGGAWATGSARVALMAGMGSLLGALFFSRKALSDSGAGFARADRRLLRHYGAYALPIVASVVLYQLIPLVNRDLAARYYGFAETGRFALAYDLGLRAVAALGSALDVLLFQIAVRAHDLHGQEKARDQIARNTAVVFALLLPACVGIWIVIPSIEVLIVPAAYRGAFGHFLTLMLPGLFCNGLSQFSLNAVFQIARKTRPMVIAAMIVCIADPLIFLALPRADDASSLAIAQSVAMAAGFVALLGFAQANRFKWPPLRDLAWTLVATLGMVGLAGPWRNYHPGLLQMAGQMVAAGGFYLLVVGLFDVAGLRTVFLAKAEPLLQRAGLLKKASPLSIE
jgi:O-antigen/teichoic acid export membrane protein